MDNLSTVREMYAAFGRRDIPALFAGVDENIQWQAIIGAGSHVPTAGKRQGKQAVAEFFQILAKTVDFSRFEPREFIADGDAVVALGEYAGRSIATGRSVQAEWRWYSTSTRTGSSRAFANMRARTRLMLRSTGETRYRPAATDNP